MALTIGMELPPLVLKWAAGAAQTFAINWMTSTGAPYDLTSVTVQLVVSSPAGGADAVLVATNSGSYSTFNFTSAQSLASYIGRPVQLQWLYAGQVYLMSSGVVVSA